METTQAPVRRTRPINYAIGMFGTSIPVNMFKTYAAIFYVDRLSLITTKQFSLVLLLYTFLDALDNPVYGFLSDRTRSKWGRRRLWLLIGAPLLVICFILFYNPPGSLGPGTAFPYIMLMYMLTGTLDSLINSNYGALFPELFRTEAERAKTNAMRQIFQFIAMIISIALTPIVTSAIGYANTSFIYGALAIAVIWYMTLNSHENLALQDKPKPQLFKTIATIASNPKFWIYGIANAAFFAGLGLVQAGVPFYVKYHLIGKDMDSTILLGVVLLSTIALIPVWVQIIKKMTLMPAWRLALIVCGASLVPLYFVPSLPLAIITVVIFGFGLAGVSTTMDIVGARILDEDAEKHGIQREGTYSSLIGVLNKTSGLFSSLAFYLMFQIFRFENGDNPGPVPDQASRFLTVLFPLGVMVICVVMSRFLHFPERKAVAPGQAETE
ncbi:MAG: Glucuronide carrier protein [Firmicutes bacterium ADurb.Bin248]|nr:MAG: Glucuronide carrier protein [Firmicutes bacterium ADurb.Bin248]HOG01625.1 MFS transporter [Clostridia bacterium]HPK15991.1 MFS transporter [Clostridia bacterium]